MNRAVTGVGCAILIALATACNGSGALDCALLRGDNCWKTMVNRVRDCGGQTLDGGTVQSGTLSVDRLTCSYPDGREVLFDRPVSFPLDHGEELSFTVEKDGQACFSFFHVIDDGAGSQIRLTVGGETVRVEGTPPDEAALFCPDGSAYRGSGKALLACESSYDKLEQILPGIVWQGSGSSYGGLELNGAGSGSPVTLFSCNAP